VGQTLYLECNTGISGDMMVAALLDLGADEQVLKTALASIPAEGFSVEISRVKKAGLDVCDFLVKLDEKHENHDHDMEYLYGHVHDHEHHHDEYEHHHGDSEHYHDENEHYHDDHEHHHGEHEHDHSHGDGEHTHSHQHRGMKEIRHIIQHTRISPGAKNTALHIFEILAQAEAKAHGTSVDEVHFHEVGAVDSIVDIVAAAVCLDNLEVTEVIVPRLCEGTGTVRCQHGILPIPVPAVANIAAMNHLPLTITGIQGELVTPTGAAIVAAVKTGERLPEQFTIRRMGMGAGKRSYEQPSILRAMLIEEAAEQSHQTGAGTDCILKLETNIDDCTGEVLGYVMERLFAQGAKDVYYTPIMMKKNRPATMLTVLCGQEQEKAMEEIIFKETTTIGIRRIKMDRTVLTREAESLQTPAGELRVKKCTLPDGTVRRYPEYASAAELAQRSGSALQDILKSTPWT
jgi:hypothetical protein